MPTKALLRDAAALRAARALPAAGGRHRRPGRRRRTASPRPVRLATGTTAARSTGSKSAGITLVRGHGRITGTRPSTSPTPTARTTSSTARHAVVIATGSRARYPRSRAWPSSHRGPAGRPRPPGRCRGGWRSSAAASSAPRWPRLRRARLAGDADLPDPAASRRRDVRRRTRRGGPPGAGVTLHLDTEAAAARRDAAGTVHLTLGRRWGRHADEVLVATGRTPNTRTSAWTTSASPPATGSSSTSPSLSSTRPEPVDDGWLYAAGDVNERALLTHHGKYQARALGDAIAARARGDRPDLALGAGTRSPRTNAPSRRSSSPIPRSRPSACPPRPRQPPASRSGSSTTTSERSPAPALHADGYRGQARMVVDEDRKVLIGFTVGRPRRRRAAARRHDRHRRGGPARPALARRPGVPDHQRDLAPPARDRRPRPLIPPRDAAGPVPGTEKAHLPVREAGLSRSICAPVGIRTPNLLIRSQMLYPLSYRRSSVRPMRLRGLVEDSRRTRGRAKSGTGRAAGTFVAESGLPAPSRAGTVPYGA